MLQTPRSGIRSWMANQLLFQKLNNPFGLGLLLLFGILVSYLIATLELKIGVILLIAIIGIPVVGACLLNPIYAIWTILIVGVLVGFLKKIVDAPFGTALDGLLFISLFGVLIQQIKERDLSFAKNPISGWVLVWVILNILEVLNPWAGSRLAWLYTVRSMAGLIILYFVATYAFNSYKIIIKTIKRALWFKTRIYRVFKRRNDLALF